MKNHATSKFIGFTELCLQRKGCFMKERNQLAFFFFFWSEDYLVWSELLSQNKWETAKEAKWKPKRQCLLWTESGGVSHCV